ncbi:hypothetical protein H310_02466 [Aphanomyces invadans]|uniref:RxLR effector protein n=1 Tax=Aphanomyces invadans TaxID=157072 RepID=A0A024UPJ5_9STRA|nr:hypothetical protein H310_02466 [Aphanomyces invadans]ETW08105.1 hypothetical protein H310_02466 [Aphanomyces invadans]|eukprot:XP_008864198.1 hypothetical protein H310_02466 [Aphanomyces invadans]
MRSRITLIVVLFTLLCAIVFGAAANDDQAALRGVASHYHEVAHVPHDAMDRNLLISPETRGKIKGAIGKIRGHVRHAVDQGRQVANNVVARVKGAIHKHAPKLNTHVQNFIQRAKGVGSRIADRVRNAVDKVKGHVRKATGHVRGIVDKVRARFGNKGGHHAAGPVDEPQG